MRTYSFQLKEIQYIQKKFICVKQLLGIKRPGLFFGGAKKSLEQKGILILRDEKEELREDIKKLFVDWSKKRFSAIIGDEDATHLPVVLWNADGVIVLTAKDETYTINVMDGLNVAETIAGMIHHEPDGFLKYTFSARFTASDAADMLKSFENKKDLSKWADKATVDVNILKECLTVLNGDDDGSHVLVEDHTECFGVMVRYLKTPNGIYVFAHGTPKGKDEFVVVGVVNKRQLVRLIEDPW